MSKKLKLSPWHDGSVKPVHVGIYSVKSENFSDFFSWWDGERWNGHWSIYNVEVNKNFGFKCPDGCTKTIGWRGILK